MKIPVIEHNAQDAYNEASMNFGSSDARTIAALQVLATIELARAVAAAAVVLQHGDPR